jgi:hypothetical protein
VRWSSFAGQTNAATVVELEAIAHTMLGAVRAAKLVRIERREHGSGV